MCRLYAFAYTCFILFASIILRILQAHHYPWPSNEGARPAWNADYNSAELYPGFNLTPLLNFERWAHNGFVLITRDQYIMSPCSHPSLQQTYKSASMGLLCLSPYRTNKINPWMSFNSPVIDAFALPPPCDRVLVATWIMVGFFVKFSLNLLEWLQT